MAESEKLRRNYGNLSLCRKGSAPSPVKAHKERVDKSTGDALSSYVASSSNASYLWVKAFQDKCQITDEKMKNPNGSPVQKISTQVKGSAVCYELQKKFDKQTDMKICSWPKCDSSHPCRDSDPAALLASETSVSRKSNSFKDQKSRPKCARRDSNTKLERPLLPNLPKKCASKDNFAHVVPPPPAPICFKFVHHDDSLLYASDYRLQSTYHRLQTMQRSVKARQAQSRAKLISMDHRAAYQPSKAKLTKHNVASFSRKCSIGEMSDKLKSPGSDHCPQVKRSVSSISGKKLCDISTIKLQFEQPSMFTNVPLQPKEQNKPEEKSQMKRDTSLQYFHQPTYLDNIKRISCLTWPQNSSASRKIENNHKNSMAARQHKLQESIGESQPVSLPSSPKKIPSLRSKNTYTPPPKRRSFI